MKKKLISCLLSASMLLSSAAAVNADNSLLTDYDAYSYSHPNRTEALSRGLTAIKTDSGVYLSWRLHENEDHRFGTADSNVSFNIYRDGVKIDTVKDSTNYTDASGAASSSYSVAPVVSGTESEQCAAVSVMSSSYFDIPIVKPADETVQYVYPYTDSDGNVTTEATFSFSPADCSAGDLDGDGEYEIIVKWTSSERDVGLPGDPAYSGTVRLAAYKLDGTRLWADDINLGKNVYSSAHTLQFLVYDFDRDGKAEIICQTSLGSKDASGAYVSHSAAAGTAISEFTDAQNESADYRGYGRIITGEEFLTVFNGETGAAIDTIDLPTARGSANGVDFGDDFGNRSNRFVASVAYLDGENPYAIFLRGYYFGKNGKQRTSIAGVRFDGNRLSADYRFDTKSGQPGYYEGAGIYVGQGNHNCTVADVDNDGKDEFITGALCMEVDESDRFRPKWCTFMEHGDALHIGNYDPTHPGLEFFTVHEDSGPNTMSGQDVPINYGMSVIDANTGEILFHEDASSDTGRGVMANVGAGGYYQIWSSGNELEIANGGTSFTKGSKSGFSQNFRIFWDGDLYDELLDGVKLTNWNGSTMERIVLPTNTQFYAINGTKANPSLQADLFGDWREELVYPVSSGDALRVFTTTIPTEYKMKSLMYDGVYRSGVAAQQTAYNQPPHIGFYVSEESFLPAASKITASLEKTLNVGDELTNNDISVTVDFSDGTPSTETKNFVFEGYNKHAAGKQTLTITAFKKSVNLNITVNTDFIIENGVVTGYNGSDTAAVIPQSAYGKEVTAIAENALTASPLTEITIPFNIKTIGENALPANATVNCIEGSAAHSYAVENNLQTKLVKNMLDVFAEDSFDEISSSLKQGGTDINETINGILYHVGSRTSKGNPAGDGQTGFTFADGKLTAGAGRFSTGNRHAYMQFADLSGAAANDFVLSFDFRFNTSTVDGAEILAKLTGTNADGALADIDSVSPSLTNLSLDTDYKYNLVAYNGAYYRIISDADGKILSFTNLNKTTSDALLTQIAFFNQGTGVGNDKSVSMTMDNLVLYSCESSLGKAEITVKYTTGLPVSNAVVEIDGKQYTTDSTGKAVSDLLFSGMYAFTATDGTQTENSSVYIGSEINIATVYLEKENGTLEYLEDPVFDKTSNTVNVKLANNSDNDAAYSIIAALYDNGAVSELKVIPNSLSPSSDSIQSIKFENSGTSVRVFVWTYNTWDMQPMLESKTAK